MKKSWKQIKSLFVFSWRDLLIMLLTLSAATVFSLLLRILDGSLVSDVNVPMLYVLAVILVARSTNGYLFGFLSSLLGVFLVNFIFTAPYFSLNFTAAGYPLTFFTMLLAALLTGTLTTQLKQQEKLRLETEKEKMRGNLLRAVSHDLRTPLTSILGTTTALLENGEKISPEQRELLLKESRDDAQWLIRMVENLLSITRMQGEAHIRKTPEAAEEIVGEALRKFYKRFPGVQLAVSVPDELLMVPMDAILIEQVLINLLENAVLHGGKEDGIDLSVTKEGENARFSVTDNGNGIDKDALPHLFDGRLSGEKQSEGDSKRNMGIGLSVCMSIVKAHGGVMAAENRAGGGARFSFVLPLKEE